MFKKLSIKTNNRVELIDITTKIQNAVKETEIDSGLLQIHIPHTTAAVTINENADPSVRRDMEEGLDRLVPENEPWYTHTAEGPDDMPAHIKTALIGPMVSFPIDKGKPDLGTWQGIYLLEFRNNARGRKLSIAVIS